MTLMSFVLRLPKIYSLMQGQLCVVFMWMPRPILVIYVSIIRHSKCVISRQLYDNFLTKGKAIILFFAPFHEHCFFCRLWPALTWTHPIFRFTPLRKEQLGEGKLLSLNQWPALRHLLNGEAKASWTLCVKPWNIVLLLRIFLRGNFLYPFPSPPKYPPLAGLLPDQCLECLYTLQHIFARRFFAIRSNWHILPFSNSVDVIGDATATANFLRTVQLT